MKKAKDPRSLSCREIAKFADDYVDGELGFSQAMRVRVHLLACRSCRAFVGQTRAVVDILRKYGRFPPSDEPAQELLAAFQRVADGTPKRTEGRDANIGKGVIAGFVATVALSAIMLMTSAIGVMPQLDVIGMLGGMMGTGAFMGWVAHFVIGSIVWQPLQRRRAQLPGGSYWLKGVAFGVGAWLLMMVALMPMAGAGLFGASLGMAVPIMALVLHVIFGAVLGAAFAALQYREHGHRHAHW